MRINSIQTKNVSYKGLNLFGKIKALVSKSSNDTFVRTTKTNESEQKYQTPAVLKQSLNENVNQNVQQPQKKVVDDSSNTIASQNTKQVTYESKQSVERPSQNKELTLEEIENLKIKYREKSFEKYFADYFKKVHLGKSTDGYCKLLEERLREKGVVVTFENDALTAKKVYKTLVEMIDRGVKVPKEVILMTPIDDDLLGFTPTTKEGREDLAPIFIKKGIRDDNENISQSLKALGFRHYTDETARGTLIHEIGHYNHMPLMLSEHESMQIWKSHFPNFEDEFEFGKKVSAHAITDKTGCEFVAEVYTGLINGETFDDEVMNLYKELKGPIIPPKRK